MSDQLWLWSFSPHSPIGPTCPECRHIHGSDAARAVGRFTGCGPRGYRSSLGGPIRPTRLEAIADFCAALIRQAGAA